MPSSSFYRSVATDLDRYAADLDDCASSVIDPAARRLPDALLGAATPHLQAEYQRASSDIRAGAGAIRNAAAWARAEADRLDAAAAAAAAAASAADADAGSAASGADEVADPQPALFF